MQEEVEGCDGKGFITTSPGVPFGAPSPYDSPTVEKMCSFCHGSGRVCVSSGLPWASSGIMTNCSECHGSGKVDDTEPDKSMVAKSSQDPSLECYYSDHVFNFKTGLFVGEIYPDLSTAPESGRLIVKLQFRDSCRDFTPGMLDGRHSVEGGYLLDRGLWELGACGSIFRRCRGLSQALDSVASIVILSEGILRWRRKQGNG